MQVLTKNERPQYDEVIVKIADYVMDQSIDSDLAFSTSQYCLMDTLGCGILALSYPECVNLLGPWVEGQTTPNGARVFGTNFEVDPVKAAFDIGMLVRWLDFNDTWLAAEWGHPSDNLGGIMAVMDYVNRQGLGNFKVKDMLEAMIKAHEIQGVLALENSFNQVGLDHVVLVKVATTAVVTKLLGGNKDDVLKALSHAWLDGQALRTYRHAPNTGPRKSWAAGDATSRAVRLAMMVLKGQEGYPSALSAKGWGFYDVLFKGKSFSLPQPFGSYVMENILFKISYPAEFHAQTAVECAINIHQKIKDKLNDIQSVHLKTQASGFRIINKEGKLYNYADRDHCLQYMVGVALLDGKLTAESYTDKVASNPAIDALRSKMTVSEEPSYSKDYLDPSKRSIANAVEVTLKDGTVYQEEIHYPVGHKNRREEGIPLLLEKFERNLKTHYNPEKADHLYELSKAQTTLNMAVDKYIQNWIV